MKFRCLLSRTAALVAAMTLAAGGVHADLIEEIQDRGVLKIGMAESPRGSRRTRSPGSTKASTSTSPGAWRS